MQNNAKRKRIRKKAKQRRIVILKDILILLVIQVIVLLLISPWGMSRPMAEASAEDLQYEAIVVSEIKPKYPWGIAGTNSRVLIFSNGIKYDFPFIASFREGGFSYSKLYKAIENGDQLTVGYLEDGDERVVYFCEEDGEVYRSVEGYNRFHASQRIAQIICFCLAEVFWMVFLAFRYFFVWIPR